MMRLIPLILMAISLMACTPFVFAQESATEGEKSFVVAWNWEAEPDDQGDAANAIYKEGYSLVLDEKWDEARRKFGEVISRHSKSKYIDDALYWSAYALMHTDRKKAVSAYRRFIRDYPRSSYFDDAVADFARLQVELPGPPPSPDTLLLQFGNIDASLVIDLRRLEHELRMIRPHPPVVPRLPFSVSIAAIEESTATLLKVIHDDAKLDLPIRVKIESLRNAAEKLHGAKASLTLKQCILDPDQPLKAREYAMALLTTTGTNARPASFQTLRQIALDLKQPPPLRELAISSLAKTGRPDALPVLKEIARRDPAERSKVLAVEAMVQAGKGKPSTVETLIEIFNETPEHRTREKKLLLNAIADIDNDSAFQFMKEVAKRHEDRGLQNLAIFRIGEMDGDKSVETLSELYYTIPKELREQLETIMYSVANIGSDKAIDFLATVARTGNDEELRSNAMFYLTNIGGEKARTALYKVLQRK
jgi:tetratricopeptide (TPR) repeat protein